MSRYAVANGQQNDLTTFCGALATALAGIPLPTQQTFLDSTSSDADGYLSRQFTLPLKQWGPDIRKRVCVLAAWEMLTGGRGVMPARESQADERLREMYDDAIHWFEQVAAQKITPQGVIDSSPTGTPAAPRVQSSPPRGYGGRGVNY